MKSINKKILTVLVTLVLLIGLFCGTMATAYADVSGGMVAVTNQATIYTDDTELVYSTDDEYNIPVYGRISGEGVSTFQIALNVPDFLTVIDVTTENESAGSSLIVDKTLNGVKISYTTQDFLFRGNSELFVLVVKTATAGNASGSISIDEDFYNLFVTPEANVVPYVGEFGTISVVTETSSTVMGDLNLDGEVTLADVICLQRYIVTNNEGVTDEIFEIGDIDKNGELDSIDVQYIQMYLVDAIPSLDDVTGGGSDDPEGTQGYSLYVNVLDVNGNRIGEGEWSDLEEGTLYPAIVGDFVSDFIERYQTEVVRVVSDYYGEITTEQAEQAVLVQSDIVSVYLAVSIGVGDVEVVETVGVLVEEKTVADLVLYSNMTFELQFEGEVMDKGKYKYVDDTTLYLEMGGVTVTLVYDANNDYYVIKETTGGGGSGDENVGGGESTPDSVRIHYFYLMDGNYVEVGDMGSDSFDATVSVYDFASTRHPYGESVTVSGVYYDDTFNTQVPTTETVKENSVYYVKLADVALNATLDIYEQRVSMEGTVGVEYVGTATFSNGNVTIINDGATEGVTYPFNQQLGQIDIIRGTYSQILAQVSGNMLMVFQTVDLSLNTVDEELTAIAGDYEMSVPFAPIPYRISLYANHVCVVKSGGEVRILSEYAFDGKNITFTMMGATFIAEVDAEKDVLNFVSGGGVSGGGSVGGGGNEDYPEEQMPSFICYVRTENNVYPMYVWDEKADVETIGEFINYLETKITGINVLTIHEYSLDSAELSSDDPYDSSVVYVGIVENADIIGTYDVAQEIEGEQLVTVGTLTLTERGATITFDMSDDAMSGTYTRVLNHVEVSVGDYSQVCFTIINGVAIIEYTFDGSAFETDEKFDSVVGTYDLIVDLDDSISMAPMIIRLYDNGVCRLYYSVVDVGMYYKYDISTEGIIIYEDEEYYSVYVLSTENGTITFQESIYINNTNPDGGYTEGGEGSDGSNGTVTDKNESGTVTEGSDGSNGTVTDKNESGTVTDGEDKVISGTAGLI